MPPKGLPRVKRAAKPAEAAATTKDIAAMFSAASSRAKKTAPKAHTEAIQSSDEDELLETPYDERPPSPSKLTRSKLKKTNLDENRSAEDDSAVSDRMEVDTSLPDPEALTADESDPISALDAKYMTLMNAMNKETEKRPRVRKTETMEHLSVLEEMAKQSLIDKQRAEQEAEEKRRAAAISKKLAAGNHRLTPAVASAAAAATGPTRSTRRKQDEMEIDNGADNKSSSEQEDDLIDYKTGAVDDILEQHLAEDNTVYNEETAREAEEELRRIESGQENMADTLAALTQDPLTRSIGRKLLATQGAETDAAPREMKFLNYKQSAAINLSELKTVHLPIDIGAPMLETLADCIADGVFLRICEKQLPSTQFLQFVVEVLALYDASSNDFEAGESSLTFPLSLEEALLDKRDDAYEFDYRALQSTRRHMVVSQACKTLQACFESHKDKLDWKFSWASVKALLDYFGMNSADWQDPIAALRLDITAYLNDLDKKKRQTEEDLIEEKDEEAMDVDTPSSGASQVKLKKPKRHSHSRKQHQFPTVNWVYFMEFLHLLMQYERLGITEAEQKLLLLIMMRCLVDANHDVLEPFQHIQNCITTLVRLICAGNTTPVELAVFVAEALMPTQGEAKAHAICRSWVNRLVVDPSDENTGIFRSTLAFAFAHMLMSRKFNPSTFVLPTGPSLSQLRTFFEETHQPDERRPDLYWTLKSVLWLGMACLRFDAKETFVQLEPLKAIERSLEQLSRNIKEKASAPIGLTLCKEAALSFSKLLSMIMSAYAPKSGMVKLDYMFHHHQQQKRRSGSSGSS